MVALMAGIMLSPLNVMFTSVALPTMRTALAIDVNLAAWIGTAYFIPSVAFMPLQALAAARWGARRVYAAGLLILAAGAVLAALAPGYRWLLASRVLQGAGWSALYPIALVLIRQRFPAGRQGEMMGLWESSVGVMTILAPLVAGVLVQIAGWRSLYLALALVSLAGAGLSQLALKPLGGVRSRTARSGPWPEAVALALALALILLGVTRRHLFFLVPGLLAALVWLWLARRTATPRVLRHRGFWGAAVAAHVRMLVAIAVLTALPLFFEDVQRLSPATVGGIMVIYSVFLFLGSWPGGRWTDRAGAVWPGGLGYLAMIAGVLLLLAFDARLSLGLAAVALAIRGLGAGLSLAPYAQAATSGFSPDEARTAAGLYGAVRYAGLAFGTALVGLFLQARLSHYHAVDGGAAALPAYRELWWLLAGVLLVGLAANAALSGRRVAILPQAGAGL